MAEKQKDHTALTHTIVVGRQEYKTGREYYVRDRAVCQNSTRETVQLLKTLIPLLYTKDATGEVFGPASIHIYIQSLIIQRGMAGGE